MNESSLVSRVFEGKTVRTVARDNETWWVAKDVCDVLGIKNAVQALESLADDEKVVLTRASDYMSSAELFGGKGREGGAQSLSIVNEPGLYRLIFKIRKPEAERFKRWVFHEVLPSIRETGSYVLDEHAQQLETLMELYEKAFQYTRKSNRSDEVQNLWDRGVLLQQIEMMRVCLRRARDITIKLSHRVQSLEKRLEKREVKRVRAKLEREGWTRMPVTPVLPTYEEVPEPEGKF